MEKKMLLYLYLEVY